MVQFLSNRPRLSLPARLGLAVVDRALGLARSLVVYHAIPGRQRRMKRLYAHMVAPGDLVFDIGAHAGNRTRSLAAMGCRVVALEPQPDFARLLRRLFARAPRVTVVEAAVGRAAGTATLAVSQRNPTVTTISSSWRKARAADPAFAGVEWNRSLEVPVTTRALVPGSADGGGGVIGTCPQGYFWVMSIARCESDGP